jgi:hypothetical protein
MDIGVNNVTSNVHVTDARAMLVPEVLQQIVEAVLVRLRQEDLQQQERRRDVQIDRRAAELD